MDVSGLWEALRGTDFAVCRVTVTANNPSQVVVYGTGVLDFSPGNLDQPAPHHRPDRLSGETTWAFSDRTFVAGTKPGLGGPVPREWPFDPDATMPATLSISSGLFGVSAELTVPFGSTSFALEDQGGIYVGLANSIGGDGKNVYTFSFAEPHSNRPPA